MQCTSFLNTVAWCDALDYHNTDARVRMRSCGVWCPDHGQLSMFNYSFLLALCRRFALVSFRVPTPKTVSKNTCKNSICYAIFKCATQYVIAPVKESRFYAAPTCELTESTILEHAWQYHLSHYFRDVRLLFIMYKHLPVVIRLAVNISIARKTRCLLFKKLSADTALQTAGVPSFFHSGQVKSILHIKRAYNADSQIVNRITVKLISS